jgi:hypothetical protein
MAKKFNAIKITVEPNDNSIIYSLKKLSNFNKVL